MKKKITEVLWNKVEHYFDTILAKKTKDKNYNDELANILKVFIDNETYADLTLMEMYSFEMHIFHNIRKEAEKLEKYELCDKICKVIQVERDLYEEWILAMTDEDLKDESLEEFNYTNLFFQKYNNN
jgi:hypothetical protein